MKIETTININKRRMMKLQLVAQTTGSTGTELIIKAMKRLTDTHDRLLKMKGPVEYQKKAENKKWHRMHLFLLSHEYEFFLDLRKVCKRSVSLLVAIAIDLYLDDILQKQTSGNNTFNKPDNYLFPSYIIIREVINSSICWRLYWGYPGEEHLLTISI